MHDLPHVVLNLSIPQSQRIFTMTAAVTCVLRETHGPCILIMILSHLRGPGSSVGIATDYGLVGPGSNPDGDEIFRRPNRPWGPPSHLHNGYRVFGVNCGRGMLLTTHPLLVPQSWKSRAIPLPNL